MALGRRQLFVYWRVGQADLDAALQAVRAWQSALRVQHPALHCSLFQRADGPADAATVMETYALDAAGAAEGIGEALRQHIDIAGRAALAGWLQGARHVEVFDALKG